MGGVMMKANLHKDHAKRKPHAKMGTRYFHYGNIGYGILRSGIKI